MTQEQVDSVMGIIVRNSGGVTQNLNNTSLVYAERVYLNLVRKDLQELVNA